MKFKYLLLLVAVLFAASTANATRIRANVTWEGFSAPVSNSDTRVMLFPAGQYMDIPFRLNDKHSLNVIMPGWPKVTQQSCDQDSPYTVSPSNVHQVGLTYNSTTQTYHYTLYIDSSLQGTCDSVEFKLTDGETHAFNVLIY